MGLAGGLWKPEAGGCTQAGGVFQEGPGWEQTLGQTGGDRAPGLTVPRVQTHGEGRARERAKTQMPAQRALCSDLVLVCSTGVGQVA